MGLTAVSGPVINYGITLSSSGAAGEYNEERGPSLNDLGEGTLDPRPSFCYKPGNRPGTPVFGWPGCFGGPAVDYVPIAANTSGIAATFSASAASGTVQVTLTTSAASSGIRTIAAFVPSTFAGPVSVIMIDGFQGGFAVGQGSSSPLLGAGCGFGGPIQSQGPLGAGPLTATVNIWNPLIMAGRCLSISNSSVSDTGTVYTIKGFDVYGMLMTATLAGAGSGATVNTLKAFKYILSSGISFVAAAGSSVVQIGISDIYGFPMYVDHANYATVWWGPSSAATLVTLASSLHTFGFGSSQGPTITTTTGSTLTSLSSLADVRGTFTSSNASNGTAASSNTANRLIMNISPKVNGVATISQNSFWGLVGVPQS